MIELAYVEGEFVPLGDAKVSIEDRGFVFADGVYEVIVAYNGRPFRLTEHLARLMKSAEAILLPLPMHANEMQKVLEDGIRQSGFQDTNIYLQVTRGVAPRAHSFPAGVKSNFVATFRARQEIPAETREKGVSVITTEEIRWAKCAIKSIALLPNVLANQKAVEAGVFEAIFVTSEGVVHDGTRSNIFMVKNERVYTPPKTDKILHGITRDIVLQCAQDTGCETFEDTVRLKDLFRANEVFLTGTTIEVLGIVAVNGKMIGAGVVGPVTERLNERLQQLILS